MDRLNAASRCCTPARSGGSDKAVRAISWVCALMAAIYKITAGEARSVVGWKNVLRRALGTGRIVGADAAMWDVVGAGDARVEYGWKQVVVVALAAEGRRTGFAVGNSASLASRGGLKILAWRTRSEAYCKYLAAAKCIIRKRKTIDDCPNKLKRKLDRPGTYVRINMDPPEEAPLIVIGLSENVGGNSEVYDEGTRSNVPIWICILVGCDTICYQVIIKKQPDFHLMKGIRPTRAEFYFDCRSARDVAD